MNVRLPALLLVGLLTGACAAQVADAADPDPAGLEDGTYQARVASHDGDVLVVDLVEILSGQQALDAAREDGQMGPDEDLPNDVYVRDPDARTYRVQVAADADVAVYDCTSGCELRPATFADVRDGEVEPFGGAAAPFELVVRDGEVVEMTEQYLP